MYSETILSGISFETPGGIHNQTPSRIVAAPGAFAGLGGEVERLGAHRALIICTPGRTQIAESACEELGSLAVGILAEAQSQVPVELADLGRKRARRFRADCLVAIGGGSSTGLAKAIALGAPTPIVAVPSTYSGSEMTGFCGITIDGVKRMHSSIDMIPKTVIYDAELSTSLPASVTAASALNALAHCIDSAYLATLSPLLRPAAAIGAAVLANNLPLALEHPEDIAVRQRLLYGAFLGGACLSGGFALQHGIAHALGGSFGIEHGLAHSIVLPYVTSYLELHFADALAPIANALGSSHLAGTVFDLLASSGLPTSLAAVGLTHRQLNRVAEIVIETESDGDKSDVELTRDSLDRILSNAFAGTRPTKQFI